MRVKVSKINKEYQKFCENRGIDVLEEESTKAFFKWWMSKKNLKMVKQSGEYFDFK